MALEKDRFVVVDEIMYVDVTVGANDSCMPKITVFIISVNFL